MPELIVPIITGISGALGIGTTIYGLTQGGGPTTPSVTGPTPQTAEQNRAQTAAAGQALPTLQALTGGSVSPEYAAQYAASQTGLSNTPAAAGNIQSAINQFFGLVAPGQTGLSPEGTGSPTSIIDMLSRATPGRGDTGGGGGTIDALLNSDQFKGLAFA